MNFTCIKTEGGLLPVDLLEAIATGGAEAQRPQDFGLPKTRRMTDEIAAAWSDARAYWDALNRTRMRLKDTDTGTSETREQWVVPLLKSLGYRDLLLMRRASEIDGRTYFISHRAGKDEEGPPVHIESFKTDVDRRPPSGRPRLSPHALIQEYLNRTETLWGIVSNGYTLRLLRDSARITRPAYVEFDLQQMMESERYAEFALFYRLVHRTRLPRGIEDAHECVLERYYQQAIEAGGRVREHLRDNVEEALKIFGNGFLGHPANTELAEKFRNGKLKPEFYYRQLLRLIYRLLFLMVSEERKLVGPDPKDEARYRIYWDYYSIRRLRSRIESHFVADERHSDVWESVQHTFRLYADENLGRKLGVAPLNGDLFSRNAIPDLENAQLSNADFLRGFAHLSLYREKNITRRVNYAHLDVEELGSVYESLLDFHPVVSERNGKAAFELVAGMERKTTGSHYTRPELVHELVESALVPVMQERLEKARTKEDKERALLSLKVCDPASGSGHFLLAASRTIARELAKIRSGEEQPTPSEFRRAVRDVIRHCIYGVDLNPLAVDLCKLALWIEGHNAGMPLTFLDHRIKCGNSLIGVLSLNSVQEGVPDDAFKPVTGDGKEAAKAIKRHNKEERRDWEKGQLRIAPGVRLDDDLEAFAEEARKLDEIPDDTPAGVEEKARAYSEARRKAAWHDNRVAADMWTAGFFFPLTDANDPVIPTHDRLIRFLESPRAIDGRSVGRYRETARKNRFFHWPLEFPEVFAENGGFDVVLGNPPWERIKLQEQEFFGSRDPEIARAPNKAARQRLIDALPETNPELAEEFKEAKHDHEAQSKFARASGRFPLAAVGDINTYALFAELSRLLIRKGGRAGIIVPTGIATDDTCKRFFGSLIENGALVKLNDFENRERLFPAVDSRQKFCLFTTAAGEKKERQKSAEFAFFLTRVEHLEDERRVFELTAEDLELLNPNTRTCPIFRTKTDAELTKKIYRRVPVLVNEKKEENPWGVRFMTMFHMSNDSHLFHTEPGEGFAPLYEAKMIWHFDHRFGTYAGMDRSSKSTHLRDPKPEEYADPNFTVQPRYWVSKDEVESRLAGKWDKEWLLGFRNVTNATNERTAVFSIVPRVGVGHSMPLAFPQRGAKESVSLLLGNLNCLPFDYLVRQKLAGINLTYGYLVQIPVLAPGTHAEDDLCFISSRVLKLVYAAWDMKAFAEDMGYDGEPFVWDEDRRAVLRAELDAYYAHLYGLTRDELRYILDPKEVYGEDFPGETFRVLKEKEMKKCGEYRTRRLVLEAWDRLFGKEGG